jgi:hypothetical protein
VEDAAKKHFRTRANSSRPVDSACFADVVAQIGGDITIATLWGSSLYQRIYWQRSAAPNAAASTTARASDVPIPKYASELAVLFLQPKERVPQALHLLAQFDEHQPHVAALILFVALLAAAPARARRARRDKLSCNVVLFLLLLTGRKRRMSVS